MIVDIQPDKARFRAELVDEKAAVRGRSRIVEDRRSGGGRMRSNAPVLVNPQGCPCVTGDVCMSRLYVVSNGRLSLDGSVLCKPGECGLAKGFDGSDVRRHP